MPVIYHYYKRDERRTHFDDHLDWPAMDKRSKKRVHYLLTSRPSSDPLVAKDIERYGFGKERTLEEFQAYSGVDFVNKVFTKSAKKGKPSQTPHRNGDLVVEVEKSATVEHKPRKVFESSQAVVYDDFLPEELYNTLYHYACCADYERINTKGKVHKVWRLRDGFPLRSMFSLYYYADESKRPDPKPDWAYPTKTALDLFAEHLTRLAPQAEPFIGRPHIDWEHYSASAWIYPKDTALSLHDDGNGYGSGAFTYFLNPVWDIHWGGLLMLLDLHASQALQLAKVSTDTSAYYERKWLDPNWENAQVWDPGLAQCIFPKRNRIVFIHPEAYHFITKVGSDAGDNARMSIAGFFVKPKAE
jgi:Rps23 Pro-64 3,4-dihydroxylase Tpa1-like proline 4-hydroxylase